MAPIRRVRRGLIPALGGKKAFGSWLLVAARLSTSVGIALRTGSRPVCASVKFVWRAHTLHASRLPASVAMIGSRSVLSLQMQSLRWRPTENSRGALGHPGFGFRQARQSSFLTGILAA